MNTEMNTDAAFVLAWVQLVAVNELIMLRFISAQDVYEQYCFISTNLRAQIYALPLDDVK